MSDVIYAVCYIFRSPLAQVKYKYGYDYDSLSFFQPLFRSTCISLSLNHLANCDQILCKASSGRGNSANLYYTNISVFLNH